MIQVLTRDFGGAPLVKAALAGAVPPSWYTPIPADPEAWSAAARQVASEFAERDWFSKISAACHARGAAAEQLARVAEHGGVVVTTGQQPGLFGGPIYTWSKAFAAVTLAREIERHTGIPAAPVFWAATDDADYAEASYTVIAHGADVCILRPAGQASGTAMAATPLGDVTAEISALAKAAGSAIDPEPLEIVRQAYAPDQTIGSAYLTLLRALLEPLGMAVLDASHPSIRAAAAPTVRHALRHASSVRDALAERNRAIEAAGYHAQVQLVPHLSQVFRTDHEGVRSRVSVKDAPDVAAHADSSAIGPNVLLRPVVERQILPTVTYVAGPSELAYFAQVSAVADALNYTRPLAVPRWSGMLLEPHVHDILHRLHVTVDDFQDPHAIEGRVAREELPPTIRDALKTLRTAVQTQTATLRESDGTLPILRKAVGGFEAQVEHRIARLERRYAAVVKRSDNARLHEVAVARASLFPNGVPQERALNFIPFLARYGHIVRDEMLTAAVQHARALIGHG
jgi:bacillithiol synthase